MPLASWLSGHFCQQSPSRRDNKARLRPLLQLELLEDRLTPTSGFLTGLQAYYPFDGNGADSSGSGRDLTLVGSPGFALGKFGQALDLHGDGSQYGARSISDSVFDLG